MLEFDPIAHVYRVGGEIVPSVTQILEHAGLISDFCKREFAAQRGSMIHEACALLANGQLDWSTVDNRIMGYVLSCKRLFDAMSHWKILATEVRVYSRALRVAGTYDLLFEPALADLKSGAVADWHRLQTAAYHRLAKLDHRIKRYGIYLRADGGIPKLVEHKDRTDLAEFLKLTEDFHASHSTR